MLGAYIFIIYIVTLIYILGLILWSLCNVLPCLIIFFILRSILSDMCIATPSVFWFLFAWNIFFHPLTFNLYVSLEMKWVSQRQHIYGSCFCILSASLCLSVGVFIPLTFKVIVDMYVLIAMLLNVFYLFLLLFFSSLLVLFSPLWVWWLSLVLFLSWFFFVYQL